MFRPAEKVQSQRAFDRASDREREAAETDEHEQCALHNHATVCVCVMPSGISQLADSWAVAPVHPIAEAVTVWAALPFFMVSVNGVDVV